MSKFLRFLGTGAFAALLLLFTAAPTGPIFSNPPRNVGTISGAQQAKSPYLLQKGGLPLISLSSATISAAGAISANTALPLVYPAAYCYVSANVAATVSAAGWYYCTWTGTQAGTLFLNTYSGSGVPTIPASTTPCTTASNLTGDTSEEVAYTVTVPANSMGANGMLRVIQSAQANNTANAKTWRVRFSGAAGTVMTVQSLTSGTIAGINVMISNTGATNAQVSQQQSAFIAGTTNANVATVDTTASTTLVISAQRATATDNIVLLPPTVELISDGT